jgi:hypothetical protein
VHAQDAGRTGKAIERSRVVSVRQPFGESGTDLRPGHVAGRQEVVQGARAEVSDSAGHQPVGRGGQVEHAVTDGDPDPPLRRVVRIAERPVRQGLQAEQVVGRDGEPVAGTRQCHE